MTSFKSVNISFEFFPPKTPEGQEKLVSAAKALQKVNPQFFSVTFGAGGSTREGTISNVKVLQDSTNVTITPHLACIGCTKEELINILKHYQDLGIQHLIALRGDLPSGMGQGGEMHYASDLVKLVRKTTGDHFEITVAAYPECHPQAANLQDDILNLKRKFDAGANNAITQYFYNPDAYFHYLDEAAKLGIKENIYPGIMPITNFSKLVRFSDACGAEIPKWIRKRLESYADDHEAIVGFGIEVVYNLCQRLLTGGAPGLHFYTLNHAEISIQILNLLNIKSTPKSEQRYKVVSLVK